MSSKRADKPASGKVTFQEVGENHAGQRLDNFLLARLKGVPKSRIYRIIRKGEVRVNKKREKPDYKLKEGDLVHIPPVRLADSRAQLPPSESLRKLLADAVLYEDADLLVINKPSGLPVHGGTGVKTGLIEAMRSLDDGQDELELVHRLDKGTSGCLLLARNRKTLKALAGQFKDGGVRKVYHAIVEGTWPAEITEVSAALARQQPQGGERFVSVSRDGKSAVTRFSILEPLAGATLVEARPVTGRTHQIRVHAQLAGCPIIGDEKYAGDTARKRFAGLGIRRLCLHAAALAFIHPASGERLEFSAPRDEQFEAALRALRQAGD